jgi:hypothetical protein
MSFNSFGWSPMSEPNTGEAIILIEPQIMHKPVYIPLLSTGETIVITLVELTTFDESGGSPIDAYKVEYSVGNTDVWTVIDDSPSLDVQV